MIINHTDVATVKIMCQCVEEPNNAKIGRGKNDHNFWVVRSVSEPFDSKMTGSKKNGNKKIIKSDAS